MKAKQVTSEIERLENVSVSMSSVGVVFTFRFFIHLVEEIVVNVTSIQLSSWQFEHAFTHFRPFFLHEHIVVQDRLHLHRMILRMSGGAVLCLSLPATDGIFLSSTPNRWFGHFFCH